MKYCIQAGLHNTAEYADWIFDINPEYVFNMSPFKQSKVYVEQVSDLIPQDDWFFLGIDIDPSSIHRVRRNYGCTDRNRQFLSVGLAGNRHIGMANIFGDVHYDLLGQQPSPCVTLDDVIDYLKFTRKIVEVDILALDIEGFEYSVLKNYSWQIKPKYLHIEDHLEYGLHDVDILGGLSLEQFIINQGYALIEKIEQKNEDGISCYHLLFAFQQSGIPQEFMS